MDAFLVSTGVVALAEIGDKTQLLAFVLAVRFRRPWPIVAGIAVATLLNHGIAASLGVFLVGLTEAGWLRWVIGGSFLAFAAWTLIPDRLDEKEVSTSGAGAFLATAIAFFLVEIGDKTQVATVALAATYHSLVLVTLGTSLGLLLVNAPSVLLGEGVARRLPMTWIQRGAALCFAALGASILVGLIGAI
ncbi:MAG: TMEM165/GDT1 family protein [Alphaproteobacteria bacterium]|nr:TMEM165/GDT1 family protein [Alphaproteobacteria bacterium]